MGDAFATFADTAPADPVAEADAALQPNEPTLAAAPFISPQGQAAAPLPDVSGLVAQTPRVPLPQVPPMPGSPLQQDPRARLALMAAIGAALATGHSGGVGILHGTLSAIQAKHEEDLKQWQFQAQETKQQQLAAQNQQAIQDRAHEARLQQTFASLREAVNKAPDEETYQKIIGGYSAQLQMAGYRIQPQALMAQFRYLPPTDEQQLKEKLGEYFASPYVKSLMTQNPAMATGGAITIKRNGQEVRVPVTEALGRVGLDVPTTGPDGAPLFNPINKGSESDQAMQRASQEFQTQFGRAPKVGAASDNDWITKRAHQFTDKKDPVMEGMARTLEGLRIQSAQQALTSKASGKLTEEGTDYAATQYRVTGVMPALGMGNMEARSNIINKAAEQARILGQSPAAAIQKQAAYKADAAALTKMRTLGAAADATESKAIQQADLISTLSPKVDRTRFPIINQAIISGQTTIAGDKDATLLVNAITTFSNEYGKIMEGSQASTSGSTDSARKAATKLVSASMNPRTLQATLDQMKREMQFTIQGYNVTADHIGQRMGAAPASVPVDTPSSNPGRFTIVTKGGG